MFLDHQMQTPLIAKSKNIMYKKRKNAARNSSVNFCIGLTIQPKLLRMMSQLHFPQESEHLLL